MKFIADVHLGKLAKLLRMLGFDTWYKNSAPIVELIDVAAGENRILLTKNPALQTSPDIKLFIITNENPEIQLQQVLHHFNLKNFQPFSRCIVCNGLIKPVEKKDIALRLQPNTAKYFDEFWQCENCKGVYWKGSHYERMRKWELGIRN